MDKAHFDRVFGHLLKEARANNGLTQEELAERTGFERSFISNLETGKQSLSLQNFYELCSALPRNSMVDFVEGISKRVSADEN